MKPARTPNKQKPMSAVTPKKPKEFKIEDDSRDRIEQVLAKLNPADVSEFKGMNRPNAGALNTVKAVIMLLGQPEAQATWDAAKKQMVNPKLFI